MRGAAKGEEPEDLRAWKAGETRACLEPRYEALPPDVQHALKQALLMEQTGQCVYCGRRIRIVPTGSEHDETCHIEHFRPRRYRDQEVDYGNLFLSCNGGGGGRYGNAATCGHRKAGWFDEDCHVAPIPEQACQQHFVFRSGGWVCGDGTPAADTMIEVLNLNDPALVDDRSELIESIDGQLPEGDDAGTVEAMACELISDYAATKPDGTRDGFTHVAVRYLQQYLPQP